MIAVIADDLTGAAELAGIGLTYQLKTEVNTVVEPDCDADLLIIATDTRSLPADKAIKITHVLTNQLMVLKPTLLFKKIDSVLRGHILDEVSSQMKASGLKRALIVPGNPQHAKLVINGMYYYKNLPVQQSNYAVDPDFPATSSDVLTMLRAGKNVPLLKTTDTIPDAGIVIGEAASTSDLDHWVKQANSNTIIAGASGLFSQLLHYLTPPKLDPIVKKTETLSPRLFVFGSTFHQGKYPVNAGFINNMPVVYIPPQIIGSKVSQAHLTDYANLVVQQLKKYRNAIIAIHPELLKGMHIDPVQLTGKLATIVNYINNQEPLGELLIEGGATAWAILTVLNISKSYPLQELSPGVIRMEIAGDNQLCVTLKPGSYEWPAPVWETT